MRSTAPVQAGALDALLETALTPERPLSAAAKGGMAAAAAADGGSPVKIALFSLGNMCAHRECREALLAAGIWDMCRRCAGQ
jgi:hypothetical protein